jgi:hypothetical protein
MSYDQDPFEDPTPRMSAFASADSFRGRLVMIEPLTVERDVPKNAKQPNGPRGDKVIANVTVLDGSGPVEVYADRSPTGKFLDGPVHRGVWFNQDQIAQALQTPDGKSLRGRVLCKLETLKPGTRSGQGNPWTVTAATAEEKKQAAAALASLIVQSDESPF